MTLPAINTAATARDVDITCCTGCCPSWGSLGGRKVIPITEKRPRRPAIKGGVPTIPRSITPRPISTSSEGSSPERPGDVKITIHNDHRKPSITVRTV